MERYETESIVILRHLSRLNFDYIVSDLRAQN